MTEKRFVKGYCCDDTMMDNAKKHDEERWGNQNNRYWIEEIKSDWTPFVDKSDVLDYDKILYVLHDNQAFEDYPVALSPNVNLLMRLCDRLNEYEIEVQQLRKQFQSENEELKQENEQYKEKVKRAFRVAYNETKLTETTKKTLQKIAEILNIDFKEDNEAIYRTTSESDMKMVVELLNEFAEENEQLKQRLKLNCPNIVWRDLE